VVQLSQGKQTLGERVGAAHDLQWASKGSNINASGHFHDDMNPRYFSNLLSVRQQNRIGWIMRTVDGAALACSHRHA
ncbi:hypothetical protein, partial [Caballeronia temeraria]|uniref:hypothetical protein n=1 Tax=Caballeronia temeraria TaxID=1777137 RepID=UPI001ABF7858